ncbi:hypothetical protein MUK42_33045 [Musa troglodytarum]|uniref:Uncharacterized protein n=1 Tax=Musa troglodytarum TaxID=320322 RepID=A0A9E7JHV5_9LILI|nr:hypothetical protein MUK42_33045 [Musa troglodytarum]
MESPASGPPWLTVCALAFVFGVWAESQGSHPSVGRLAKRVGRPPTAVPTHFSYGMEQLTSHVQPLFLLHVGCRWRWDPRVFSAEYSSAIGGSRIMGLGFLPMILGGSCD